MSSILKAMRQGNTQAPQAAVADYRRYNEPSAKGRHLGWILVVLVAAGAGWLLAPYLGGSTTVSEQQNEAENESRSEFGQVSFAAPRSIEPVLLPAPAPQPDVESVQTSEFSSARRNTTTERNQDVLARNAQGADAAASDALDLDSVSPELLAAFENAVAATADMASGTPQSESVLPLLSDLSDSFQNRVPSFSYEAHNYVSANARRFIVLNGRRLQEGDYFDDLQVIRIEPQHVVLAIQRQAFRQNALEDWTGTR